MLPQPAMTIYEQMKHFKSGEIYEVLIKNNDGSFSNHNASSTDEITK